MMANSNLARCSVCDPREKRVKDPYSRIHGRGHRVVRRIPGGRVGPSYRVECTICGRSTADYPEKSSAIAAWNVREGQR